MLMPCSRRNEFLRVAMENLLENSTKAQESWAYTLHEKLNPEKSGQRTPHYCSSCVHADVISAFLELLLRDNITYNTRYYALCVLEYLLLDSYSGAALLSTEGFSKVLLRELCSEWVLYRERAINIYNVATHNFPRKLTKFLLTSEYILAIVQNVFTSVDDNLANWKAGSFQQELHFDEKACPCRHVHMKFFTRNLHNLARKAITIQFIVNARLPSKLLALILSIPRGIFCNLLFGPLSDTLMSSQILLLLLRPSLVELEGRELIRTEIRKFLLRYTPQFQEFLDNSMSELCKITDVLSRTTMCPEMTNTAHFFLNLVEYLSRDASLMELFNLDRYYEDIKSHFKTWIRLRHGKKKYGDRDFREKFVTHEMFHEPEKGLVVKEHSCWSVVCLELIQSRTCRTCFPQSNSKEQIMRMQKLHSCCVYHAKQSETGEECALHANSALLLAEEIHCHHKEATADCVCLEALYLRIVGWSKWAEISSRRRSNLIDRDAAMLLSASAEKEKQNAVREIMTLYISTCANCGTPASSSKLFRCAGCRNVHYCSQHCQAKHWPIHRSSCHHLSCCDIKELEN